MKLTVGPLPPSVYWRRRALLLGGLVLLIVLIVYSCSGSKVPSTSSTHSPSPSASAQEIPVGNPSTLPVASPPSNSVLPLPSGSPAVSASGVAPSLGPGGVPFCTDSQILVRASITSSSGKLVYGGTYTVQLTVLNNSTVTCARDVGGDPEELTVMDGSTVVWDSDQCVADQGKKPHDVRTFKPGDAVSATPSWNSWYWLKSSDCMKKQSSPLGRGTYTLVGRAGTATSQPVTFKIQP